MRLVEHADGPKRYRIIAGECRYTAARQAGLTELPCWVRTPQQERVLLEQVVENWQRSDLNPFELADSLGILRDANGFSQKQLAEMTGKTPGEISKILSLLDLDPEVQRLARDDASGRVTRKHLYAVRDFPIDRQLKLVAGIQDGRYTAESLELLRQKLANRPSPTGREHNWQRRTFKTREATVSFTFRKASVDGHDILNALRQVKRQVADDGVI